MDKAVGVNQAIQMPHSIITQSTKFLEAKLRFELRLGDSKSPVLPLHHMAKCGGRQRIRTPTTVNGPTVFNTVLCPCTVPSISLEEGTGFEPMQAINLTD